MLKISSQLNENWAVGATTYSDRQTDASDFIMSHAMHITIKRIIGLITLIFPLNIFVGFIGARYSYAVGV